MMRALPWVDDFNKRMQSYIEQNFDAAFAFVREVSEAKDIQDVFRIYSDYNQKYLQSLPRSGRFRGNLQ
jgi:Phasin protein